MPPPKLPETYCVPDSKDEDGDPLIVSAVAPTWRDLWAILRGRYKADLKVSRHMSLAKSDRILRKVWVDGLKKMREPSSFLDQVGRRDDR